MAYDDVLTRNENQELAVRVVSATESATVVNPNDVYTRDTNGNLAIRTIGNGGGGGGSDPHNLGWYATQSALETAHPTASNGDWAIVGSTDTVWVWDGDTNAWKDTAQKGQVESVNGKTGVVVLTGEDISADVDDLPNTIQGHLQSISDKIKDIELVKVPNATIVGSPAINHGQISGFSSADYLQFPFELDVQNRHLKVNFCFTTGADVITQQNVLDSYYGLALAVANGKGLMAVSHNGTSWAFQTSGATDIQPNTTYFARLTWNGVLYKTELSTDGVNYTTDMTTGSTQPPYKRTMFIGGSPDLFGAGSAHPFGGSINLNYANVEIDDNDIWEGMDDVGLGTRLDVNVSNISEEGKEKIKQIVGPTGYLPELTVAGWSLDSGTNKYTQSVSVTGVTGTNTVFVSPAPSSAADYVSSSVLCISQTTDSLTFQADSVPTNAITVNVVIMG